MAVRECMHAVMGREGASSREGAVAVEDGRTV